VPILIDSVETPLEFENLQAADLTSWGAAAEHPELQAVFDRIQALAPIPDERVGHEPAEPARREGKTARRLRELGAERARIEKLFGRGDLKAAEEALRTAEKKFDVSAQLRPLREQLDTLRDQAQHEQLARSVVESARREFDAGRHQAAIESLERFHPDHDIVTRALAELRAEAGRIEQEHAEAARREAIAAQRQLELAAAVADVEELLERPDLDAAERALAMAEREFDYPAECRPLRERLKTLRGQAQRAQRHEQIARNPLGDAPLREQSEANRQGASLDAGAAGQAGRGTLPRATSRPVLAIAAILALTVGAWLVGAWPRRAPDTARHLRPQQNQPSERSTPVPVVVPKARVPAVEQASKSTPVDSPSPNPAPIEAVPTTPGAATDISLPNEPAGSPVVKQASPPRPLEELRTRARTQWQLGQRAQALNTVTEGLRIDSRDPVLRNLQGSFLRDAQVDAERSKKQAQDLNADARAEKAFGQGLRKEREAVRLRRAGRIDAATRSFCVAAEQFKAAATESGRIAGDEDAEQARLAYERAGIKKKEGDRASEATRQRPNAGDQAERKSPNTTLDQEGVTQTLRRFETAYASLSADLVRSVYPSAPIDQLAKDFAGYRSYTLKVQVQAFTFIALSETRAAVEVPARVVHDVMLKSGRRNQFEQSQTFQLEKQGQTWIIRQIH